jgi:hypothetical protein
MTFPLRATALALAGALLLPAAPPDARRRIAAVIGIRGLAAFWDFVLRDPEGRFLARTSAKGATGFPLQARNIVLDYWGQGRPATYADFPLLGRGPFGEAIEFAPSPDPDFRPVLLVPRATIHSTPLDVKGPRQSVSMLAWVLRTAGNHAIAGIWHEGTDMTPDADRAASVQTGRRQYALFAGLAANPGAVAVHLSENGRNSFGDRYARNLAVTPEKIPLAPAGDRGDHWTVAGFVFDNRANRMTAYIDGAATEYWIDSPAQHPFYRWAHQGWRQAAFARLPGEQPGADAAFPRDQFYAPPERKPRATQTLSETANEKLVLATYEYTKVRVTYHRDARGRFTVIAKRELTALKVNPFFFGHDLFAPARVEDGGPFTVGRVVHNARGAGMEGWIGGIAVFHRALSPREMARLAAAARP